MFKLQTFTHLAWFFLIVSGMHTASAYTLETGEVLQDPTKPQVWVAPKQAAKIAAGPSFELNYIVANGADKRAMINGRKVVEGDVVLGATVKKIQSDRVSLIYQGQIKELRMNSVKGIQRN